MTEISSGISCSFIPVVTIDQLPSGALSVAIKTNRLFLESVKSEHLDLYMQTFGDPEVMKNWATGETKSAEAVAKRIDIWVKRWESGNPFSAFTIFNAESKEFVGHIVVGHGDRPGQSEMAFLFRSQFWGKGYEEEAVSAMLQSYVPELVKQEYEVRGARLDEVHATVKPELLDENELLAKYMELKGRIHKFGGERNDYSIVFRNLQESLPLPSF